MPEIFPGGNVKHLVSLDPGGSSAYAVIKYSDKNRPTLLEYAQVVGGVEGFLEMIKNLEGSFPAGAETTWICEKFSPRPGSAAGFSQSLKTSLPLVCEGVLIGRGLMPVYSKGSDRWMSPALQYFLPGKTPAEKKKKRRIWLAENGFKVMPKDVGQPDCDDVRSAISHGIAWLRRQKHKPTLELFREDEDD